jgi:hypothetical protein
MESASFRGGRSIGPVGMRVFERMPTPTLPAFAARETWERDGHRAARVMVLLGHTLFPL